MADQSLTIFCGDVGLASPNWNAACCYQDNQADSMCSGVIYPDPKYPESTLWHDCRSGDCVQDCQNPNTLYNSFRDLNDPQVDGPIQQYWMCLSLPIVAQMDRKNLLSPNESSFVRQFIPANTSLATLKKVTSATTRCLTETCDSARNSAFCREKCLSVNLLVNSTTPDINGIQDCLSTLCEGATKSLPFANSDVMGIGVFTSYIMQCSIVAVIALAFAITALWSLHRKTNNPKSKITRHKDALISSLVEFHKAQCFFSSTIQIASLASGIFNINILDNFLLLPLATNGVLPVVLGYIMVVRYGHSVSFLTILTLITWILSTLVFWTLYRRLIPLDWSGSDSDIWQIYYQFMFSLSANPSCGGSSALAVCAESLTLGVDRIGAAAKRIHAYPPFIWAWSTFCLVMTLAIHYLPRLWDQKKPRRVLAMEQMIHDRRNGIGSAMFKQLLTIDGLFWLAVLVSIVALGLQLSLLSIDVSLSMMDTGAWNFGQIVAVTIWVAPMIEYIHLLSRGVEKGSQYRFSRNLSVTRDASRNTNNSLPVRAYEPSQRNKDDLRHDIEFKDDNRKRSQP